MSAVFDPSLDLVLQRIVPVPAEHLWRGWTDPTILVKWFTPPPWVTTEAEIDPRPGGIFRTVMQGPDGERGGGTGCVLLAEPDRRFAWTGCLGPEFRPQSVPEGGFSFTAIVEFDDREDGTLFRATVRHGSAADARAHESMGFEVGWGIALDQLVALY